MIQNSSRIGMIGLGTMGRNLLLNMADHGFAVAGYDKDPTKTQLLEAEGRGKEVRGFSSLPDFIGSLQMPRVLMLLVPAGKIVDTVIDELRPLLQKGDIIIDAGNSHFSDTNRRITALEAAGLHFFGMGISGGEEGARYGPSMMPGGDTEAYQFMQPVLEAIAARVDGEPCVTYIGPGASGHFVKMVHNGIEYALMQLIADTYEMLRKGLHYDNPSIHRLFSKWNKGRLQSYLLEITSDIFLFKEPGSGSYLLDEIKDQAKAKGTGKWTSQVAMDLQLPVPSIDISVGMRDLSKHKSLRRRASEIYNQTPQFTPDNGEDLLKELEEAFYFSMVTIYSQGMHLLQKASEEYGYDLRPGQIARIWRGGCIIRSAFLETIYAAFQTDGQLPHLLLDAGIGSSIKSSLGAARKIVSSACISGLSMPAYTSAVVYFDAMRSENMPANLIQAQRDYFGAHTYELKGVEGVFHSKWKHYAED